MDWVTGNGLVSINPKCEFKKAKMLQGKIKPAEWTSKYSSVTFDLTYKLSGFLGFLQRFLPFLNMPEPSCGLNEAGLYCGSLWVHTPPDVKYPPPDARPSINNWQYVEYALDNYATVKEAVKNIDKIRISGFKEGALDIALHWYLADKSGDSAVIEFPDGKLSVHHPAKPPVMTNSFYEHSRQYLSQFKGYGGSKDIPFAKGEMTSENRFAFAVSALDNLSAKKARRIDGAFDVLAKVTQTSVRHAETSQALTQWAIAYDLNSGKIEWFTRENPSMRTIDFGKTDTSKAVRKNIDE